MLETKKQDSKSVGCLPENLDRQEDNKMEFHCKCIRAVLEPLNPTNCTGSGGSLGSSVKKNEGF